MAVLTFWLALMVAQMPSSVSPALANVFVETATFTSREACEGVLRILSSALQPGATAIVHECRPIHVTIETDGGSYAVRPPAGHRRALLHRHVLAQPAHVDLVGPDRAVELIVVVMRPGFAGAVEHEPRRRLLHADVAGQLHAGHALERREAQVDRERPLPQRDLRPLHRRVRLHREVRAAVRTPVGHPPVVGLTRPRRSALRTVPAVRPKRRLEPRRRRGLVGEGLWAGSRSVLRGGIFQPFPVSVVGHRIWRRTP